MSTLEGGRRQISGTDVKSSNRRHEFPAWLSGTGINDGPLVSPVMGFTLLAAGRKRGSSVAKHLLPVSDLMKVIYGHRQRGFYLGLEHHPTVC